tara:strand:+ start:146 stop:505 length:360 start_codon:yes stop_codon:yes gene_type:complete
VTTKDLIGTYNIIGKNQEETELNYTGTLTLALDHNSRIVAKWLINKEQVQEGTGFFKDNILVINFNYLGENDEVFIGVVVYRCLTKNILEGFWSEEYGNPKFLGEERCFRVTNEEVMLD